MTIKLKLTKPVADSLYNILSFVANQINVTSLQELAGKESLTNICKRLEARRYTQRKKIQVSLQIHEVAYFQNFGNIYKALGDYERAVWHEIEKNITDQVNREIQIRMINYI